MPLQELLSRFRLLPEAPKSERPQLSRALEEELMALSLEDLGNLLCLCDNALADSQQAQRTAFKMLFKACRGRSGLTARELLRGGIALPSLVRLAEQEAIVDLPPARDLLDELLAFVLSWQPSPEQHKPAGGGSLVVLGAVRHLGMLPELSPDLVPMLLEHALAVEYGPVSLHLLAEAGKLVPSWTPKIMSMLLCRAIGDTSVLPTRQLIKLMQKWRLHEDADLVELFHQASRSEALSEADVPAAEARRKGVGQEPATLPVLQLADERVVFIGGSAADEAVLKSEVERALSVLAAGGDLRVAMDAEWCDPRPLSLVQLAVESSDRDGVTVLLVDLVCRQSEQVLSCCRQLLQPEAGSKHEVITFSSSEDQRRLVVQGILDECHDTGNASSPVPGWLDLQGVFGTKAARPSLRHVVAKELGVHLDKAQQQSDWDRRPLLPKQLQYAALDASVLLQLRRRLGPGARSQVAGAAARSGLDPASSLEEVKAHWRARLRPAEAAAPCDAGWVQHAVDRSQRRWTAPHAGGEDAPMANGHLRFVLHASFAKLMRKMRGLGLDTTIMPEGFAPAQLARAAVSEDRVILLQSRRLQLPAEAVDRVYALRAKDVDEQLREVIEVFGVDVDPDSLCGRCVCCNGLVERATAQEVRANAAAAAQVSEHTFANFSEFWLCQGCGKVFWEGGMFEKAVAHFRTFMPEAREGGEEPAEASARLSEGAGETGQLADKYAEMSMQGCSEQRIRAQMVRDGLVQAPAGGSGQRSPCPSDASAVGLVTPSAGTGRAAAAALFRTAFERRRAEGLDPAAATAEALRDVAGGGGSR